MTAGFIVAAVALLALVIDTGRLYAAQQKLQSTANLAAIAAARAASGCRTQAATDGKSAAMQVVNANYSGAGFPTLVEPPKNYFDQSGYQQGKVVTDSDSHIRHFSSNYKANEKPDAVRLTLTDSGFKPLFSLFGGAQTLQASAGAKSQPTAQLLFGTTLAKGKPKLLANLLGIDVNLLDIGDLANTSVTLAQLLDINADLATQQQLADITINKALNNVSDALSTVAPAVVNAIRDGVGDQPLSKILGTAGSIGTSASVSLGAIINGAAQLVAKNRPGPVSIPLNLSLLGGQLADISASVKILEPAKSVIGPAGKNSDGDFYTSATSAQVALALKLDLNVLGVVKVHLPLALEVAPGTVNLEHIHCPTASDRYYTVTVNGSTSLLDLAIGSIDIDDTIDTSDTATVDLLGLNIATISNKENLISHVAPKPISGYTYGPIDNLDELPKTYAPDDAVRVSDLTGLLSNLNLNVDLLSNHDICHEMLKENPLFGLLGCITNGLGSIVNGLTRPLLNDVLNNLVPNVLYPLVDGVLGPILNPVLDALGISIADPTITLTGITPDQAQLFCASQSDCYDTAPNAGNG